MEIRYKLSQNSHFISAFFMLILLILTGCSSIDGPVISDSSKSETDITVNKAGYKATLKGINSYNVTKDNNEYNILVRYHDLTFEKVKIHTDVYNGITRYDYVTKNNDSIKFMFDKLRGIVNFKLNHGAQKQEAKLFIGKTRKPIPRNIAALKVLQNNQEAIIKLLIIYGDIAESDIRKQETAIKETQRKLFFKQNELAKENNVNVECNYSMLLHETCYFDGGRSLACEDATNDLNVTCSNSACIGCCELLSDCDCICVLEDYLCTCTRRGYPCYVNTNPTWPIGGNGKMICDLCGYIYDPAIGDCDSSVQPGTKFTDLPSEWTCPICGSSKDNFSEYSR